MENFLTQFNALKKLIDMDKLILAQARFLDYKSAALNLEKVLDNMAYSGNNHHNQEPEYIEKLGLLYSVSGDLLNTFKR